MKMTKHLMSVNSIKCRAKSAIWRRINLDLNVILVRSEFLDSSKKRAAQFHSVRIRNKWRRIQLVGVRKQEPFLSK